MSLPLYEMRSHGHHHSRSLSYDIGKPPTRSGNASYQVVPPVLGSTSTPTNSTHRPSGSVSFDMTGGGQQSAPPNSSGLPGANAAPQMNMAPRGQEELHLPPNYAQANQQLSSPRGPAPDSRHVPNSLHPGSSGRPAPTSANTAPSSIPTLPPITTQPPQEQLLQSPSRASTASYAHSYPRSSPAVPHGTPPDDPRYKSPPAYRYTQSQTPQTGVFSPLGLEDIRQGDIGDPLADQLDPAQVNPTNCNYLAPWAVYAYDWCKWPTQHQGLGDAAGKMAVGSYLEDGHNFIQVLETQIVPDPDPDATGDGPQYGLEYTKVAEASHGYPLTRILWEPESSSKSSCDLLATSGDHLRLWKLPPQKQYNPSSSITRPSNVGEPALQKLTPLALLSNSKSPEHTAPLTSLDWNTLSPSLIITSSIDTTCTIWDIPSLTAKTQLIAHDKEVYDVRFCANSTDVFVSCGADGSVRMFDLRSLEHSTIIYEPSEKADKSAAQSPGDASPSKAQHTMTPAPPLLRLAASPHDAHLLATFSSDSRTIRILDIRQPGQALLELQGHSAPVNCIEWSPSRRGTLASGGDDSLVLVWDLLNQSNAAALANGTPGSTGNDNSRGPAASWLCDYEVCNLSWSPQSGLTSQGDWIGVAGGRGLWAVNL